MIETEFGPRPIELVRARDETHPGDRVWSINSDGKLELSEVQATFDHQTEQWLDIEYSDFQVVHPTPNHPFYLPLQNIYVSAGELKVGDVILRSKNHSQAGKILDLDFGAITRITRHAYAGTHVYNLEVSKNHNYFADGVLVHNKTGTASSAPAP